MYETPSKNFESEMFLKEHFEFFDSAHTKMDTHATIVVKKFRFAIFEKTGGANSHLLYSFL